MKMRQTNNLPEYDGGMNIVEELTLIIALLTQTFITYLILNLATEGYEWWMKLLISIGITTAIYFACKIFVKWIMER